MTTIILVLIIIMLMLLGMWKFWLLLVYWHVISRMAQGRETRSNSIFTRKYYSYADAMYRYLDIQTGMIPSFRIRDYMYRHLFHVQMAPDVVLHYGAEIRCHRRLQLGEGTIVGDKALLDARNGIVTGRYVNFSSNVQVYTEQHNYRDPMFGCYLSDECSVHIDDRAWIGPSAIILPGVHIGEGAVVAGGAVVTKDVEPYTVVAGIPARKVSTRPRDLNYKFLERRWSHIY